MSEAPMTDGGAATQVDVQRLYAEHWHSLVRLAYLLTDSTGAAEDLVQDAFISLYRGSERHATLRCRFGFVMLSDDRRTTTSTYRSAPPRACA